VHQNDQKVGVEVQVRVNQNFDSASAALILDGCVRRASWANKTARYRLVDDTLTLRYTDDKGVKQQVEIGAPSPSDLAATDWVIFTPMQQLALAAPEALSQTIGGVHFVAAPEEAIQLQQQNDLDQPPVEASGHEHGCDFPEAMEAVLDGGFAARDGFGDDCIFLIGTPQGDRVVRQSNAALTQYEPSNDDMVALDWIVQRA
jgi:hypothetical protein